MQAVAPEADTLSPTHAWQPVVPGKAENVPAAQGVHTDEPAALNVPAGQRSTAAAPLIETTEPAGAATQAPEEVEPVSGLYVPLAQALHAELSVPDLYVPADAAG